MTGVSDKSVPLDRSCLSNSSLGSQADGSFPSVCPTSTPRPGRHVALPPPYALSKWTNVETKITVPDTDVFGLGGKET
ncbi:hypothetical protein AG1IA_00818 [Rhizoctonia solani AG-1 IA]|uniref:Uncharacterized protein n=1 Tax=Thanatephorus cucumeris (strain AG1-IA) TaxID=983506 RepID=L8X918_THACA|nr:hypothetical protein AG1IA_00818 [Rhizoctonia solani AG-1 IA]